MIWPALRPFNGPAWKIWASSGLGVCMCVCMCHSAYVWYVWYCQRYVKLPWKWISWYKKKISMHWYLDWYRNTLIFWCMHTWLWYFRYQNTVVLDSSLPWHLDASLPWQRLSQEKGWWPALAVVGNRPVHFPALATLWSQIHRPLVALSPIFTTEYTHVTVLEDFDQQIWLYMVCTRNQHLIT